MEIRHSEEIGALIAALAEAQLEFKPVKKTTDNPFYNRKYADLSTMIEATRPALASHGLIVTQAIRVVAPKAVEVSTMLAHSSGQFMAYDVLIPATQKQKEKRDNGEWEWYDRFDAQTIGIASTYGRRYSYGAILCIAGEEDDDGNGIADVRNGNGKANGHAAEENPFHPHRAKEVLQVPSGRTINATESRAFWSAVKQGGKNEKQVQDFFSKLRIDRTEEMRHVDFDSAMKWAVGSAVAA